MKLRGVIVLVAAAAARAALWPAPGRERATLTVGLSLAGDDDQGDDGDDDHGGGGDG